MIKRLAGWVWRRLGRLHWIVLWLISPKYCIGVNAIILNTNGDIWLQQHRYWPKQSWGLPGGMMSDNELPEQALQREIKEELGRSLTIKRLLKTQRPFRRGLVFCYLAEMGTEPLVLDQDEVIQADFYNPDKLPQPMLDSHKQLINQALAEL